MDRLSTLVDLIGRHAPGDGAFTAPLPGVTLIRASAPTLPMLVIRAGVQTDAECPGAKSAVLR